MDEKKLGNQAEKAIISSVNRENALFSTLNATQAALGISTNAAAVCSVGSAIQAVAESSKPVLGYGIMPGMTTAISLFGKTLLTFNTVGAGIVKAIQSERAAIISQTALNVINGIGDLGIKFVNSPLMQWIQTVDFSPMIKVVSALADPELQKRYSELHGAFLCSMYETHWFPYAGWIADVMLFHEVNQILESNPDIDIKTRKIDQLIFTHYSKEEINLLRNAWKEEHLPRHIIRTLNEAVNAYHRHEHALTVAALFPIWEGIIAEKTHQSGHRTDRKTKEGVAQLIQENKLDEIFKSFVDDFIYYQCNGPEDVKEGVPGRHAVSHGWFSNYPSRKVALNAILFTDFLLGLEPLPSE